MPVIYQKWITRKDLQTNPDKLYVFGDNLIQEGYGGQARAMRGEPNAVGIATKLVPTSDEDAFFTDSLVHLMLAKYFWRKPFGILFNHVENGGTVIWPEDGIGTGLSEMPTRCPVLFELLENFRTTLENTKK